MNTSFASPQPSRPLPDGALEQRFQLLIDTVVDYGIFVLDPQGHVASWNTGAEKLKGYRREEVLGRHFSVFYPPEAIATGWPQEELRRATQLGRFEDEGWRVRKDGSRFWANVVITALFEADGRLSGFAKITRDLTERRAHEEQLRESEERFRLLVNSVRDYAIFMLDGDGMQLEALPSPALRNCRDVIDRQLTHVTRLVDDLLDVGRLTTGKIKLRKELVRVGDVVARSVETARPQVEARRHTLRVEQPAQPVFVHGDTTRLSQVIQNLLGNAAKFTPDGGQVVVKIERTGNFVATSVSDNGRGLPAADRERIFELFVQGEDISPSESGLGLGLTLARSLVELHGGQLDAQSAGPGQGSTFTFRLPVAQVDAAEHPLRTQEQAGGSLRVLVVDDNRDSADSTTAILGLLGHVVECVYDGQTALRVAPQFRPGLVLLDLAMPGLDGFETRSRLVALPGLKDAYTVAMTGYGNEEDKRRTREAGFDSHLTKPVELESLMALLHEGRRRTGAATSG